MPRLVLRLTGCGMNDHLRMRSNPTQKPSIVIMREPNPRLLFLIHLLINLKPQYLPPNITEFISCHEMDELKKESGPTPNTSYRDVNIQKETSAEDDFETLNISDVTLSRASSPCLSIMEHFEWIDRELGNDSLETSPKPNVNFITNYNTRIQATPQPLHPPQPEKTEAPESRVYTGNKTCL
ncbi:hypothetical protein J6590_103286 [Homalodisca vitripennis]|nr:hypothetical protein J6590_103286 [Homalodisca vitripennis]